MLIIILLSIFAALCFGVATSIQKYSFLSMKRFSLKKMLLNKKWLFSILITIFGVFSYLSAIRTANLSTVQPILSLSLVVPVVCGILFFKEKVDVRKCVSLILIIAGVVLVSIY